MTSRALPHPPCSVRATAERLARHGASAGVLALALCACSRGGDDGAGAASSLDAERAGEARTNGAPRPNVLFLCVDTLRADRLGAYGYPRGTSPRIDAFAAESVVFERAVAPASWTLPSFATLLTSLYSSSHECWTRESRLGEAFHTLPEILRGAGYRTAGFASHVFFQERHGLQQGFDTFDDELTPRRNEPGHVTVTSDSIAERAAAWIGARPESDEPWMLWVHFFDPHFLYVEHAGVSEAFGVETDSDLYDGEIAWTDRWVGRVLDALAERGLAGDTLVVLTADHGEAFEEHGQRYHGHSLHAEETAIPLVMRVPGVAPRRVSLPVGTVDVLPTLLDLLELAAPSELAGRSLVPLLEGRELEPAALLSEVRLFEGEHMASVVRGGWKLVIERGRQRPLLFDVESDPGERHNVANRHPERVAELREALRAELERAARLGREYAKPGDLRLDALELQGLEQLGYTGDE